MTDKLYEAGYQLGREASKRGQEHHINVLVTIYRPSVDAEREKLRNKLMETAMNLSVAFPPELSNIEEPEEIVRYMFGISNGLADGK